MHLSRPHTAVIAIALASLMILTRGHHAASIDVLPSASWAVFYLGGLYLRSARAFGALLLLAAGLDLAAVGWGGASGFCTSPAYPFLLPAYGAMWLAGRWYATRHRFDWATLLPFAASALVGAHVCELFSSGGFYLFSGHFSAPSLAGFGERLLHYYPQALAALGFWLAVAAITHGVFAGALGGRRPGRAAAR